VAAVRWKANNGNSGRFLLPISLRLLASIAAFEPPVILYNSEEIIHKVLTS
jgi:hypothetical protein